MTLWQGHDRIQGFCWSQGKTARPELQGNLMQKSYLLGPTTWKVTQRNVWKDIANLRIKWLNNLCKVATPCMDHHQFKEKEKNESVGGLSTVCLQIVYLARIGRLDIVWSVNKLARHQMDQSLRQTLGAFDLAHSSFKWIPAILLCGKHSTTMQTWIVSRLWFCWRLWRFNINIRRSSVHFRNHTFVPISWMCKKQTSVSHSSPESEIVSLDAGLRMDGIPALTLWDLVIEVFHSVPNKIEQPKEKLRRDPSPIVKSNMHNPIPIKHTNVSPTNIDNIPTNTRNSWSSAMFYVFEDNEAVIKMIMKGRRPTMRHVSRTHKVALDWLFDRINLDPKIQIRYLTPNTKSQTSWPKGISHVMSGRIFFICSISAIPAPLAVPRISAW